MKSSLVAFGMLQTTDTALLLSVEPTSFSFLGVIVQILVHGHGRVHLLPEPRTE